MSDRVGAFKTTLRDALNISQQVPSVYRGWLFLPPQPWALETEGIFFDPDKNNRSQTDQTPEEIRSKQLALTLDSDSIEDVIFNARAQRPDGTIEELLAAFTYYFNNDAFMKFG
jgi:hypothetical protein